jgi:hypothetical protein
VQAVPDAHPTSCTIGTMSFPVGKRPRRGVDHPLLSTVEVVNGLELYLRLTSVPAYTCHSVTFLPKPFYGYEVRNVQIN